MSIENQSGVGGSPQFGESACSACFNGITKEMWTVLLDKPEGWQSSDVFCDTREQAESQLATLREIDAKYQPESTQLHGAVVTRCIVSIYLPNVPSHRIPLASGAEGAQAASVPEVPKAQGFGGLVCSHF